NTQQFLKAFREYPAPVGAMCRMVFGWQPAESELCKTDPPEACEQERIFYFKKTACYKHTVNHFLFVLKYHNANQANNKKQRTPEVTHGKTARANLVLILHAGNFRQTG